ncbi:type II toxin-antitoxin system PemK/MazF family toxin [Halomonas sp. DQ26W]|uniref:type II toxin-antitoxin system PemK/MazF family toxin n=1 Tax=Halomonas sp. DQ26W TaxID=2282311 RepID=UPI000DF836F9|nr:type II toxin-antitoxin system PemK/MazF family toxin [Halomonas sp. DQ26W]RDB41845.1 type II toxin-antitoxin system PemK/MazF family toxin [Halomonas sp. DQ26W]
MKQSGQIALMPFPYTNLASSKKRPVLLLRQLDHAHDDWLVCMVSSQLHQAHPQLDWVLSPGHDEFLASGLKVASVFRLSRLAILDGSLLLGQLGLVSDARLNELRRRLALWVQGGAAGIAQ